MLQIIGWLGCLMLAVKLVELMVTPSLRGEDGRMSPGLTLALLVAWLGCAVFALLLYLQGTQFDTEPDYAAQAEEAGRIADCMESQTTAEDMMRCYD